MIGEWHHCVTVMAGSPLRREKMENGKNKSLSSCQGIHREFGNVVL